MSKSFILAAAEARCSSKTQSVFIGMSYETLANTAMCVTIQTLRRRRSIPDTQSQVHSVAEIVSYELPVASFEFKMVNRHVYFEKCSQHFIGLHNKTSGIVALCGDNPKLSALAVRT